MSFSSARTLAVNITTEPAILTSIVPASTTGLFGRVNSASRTSGSFGALCAAQLAAPSAHAAPTAATTGPAPGVNGSQKPAGRVTAATPSATNDSQQNNIPAPTGVLSQFLPTPGPTAAPLEAALPDVATGLSSSPAAGGNAANSPANRSSQISPGTLTGAPSPSSATEHAAGTALNTLSLDSTMPAASAGASAEPFAAQRTTALAPLPNSDPRATQTGDANSQTLIVSSVLPAARTVEGASVAATNPVLQSTDQPAASVAFVAPAAASGPPTGAASPASSQAAAAQSSDVQAEFASTAVAQIPVAQTAVVQAGGDSLPPATSALASFVSFGPQGAGACESDILASQASVPGGSAGALQDPQDASQSATDIVRVSTTVADKSAARIEPDRGLTPPPHIPHTDPQPPAGQQSAAERQSATPQNPPLATLFPSTTRTPGTSAMPRFATAPRPTPPPSDAAPLATQSANSSSSSSVVPLPSPAPSGNLLGKNSNLTSPSGNRSFPPTAAGGSSPSAAASQTVNVTSTAEDDSQPNTSDNGTPDSPPHKTTAAAAAQTVAPPASAPTAGTSSADPPTQSAMPAAAQGTPLGITPGLTPGMSALPSAPGSARQTDSSNPAGSDSPLNLPASAQLPAHPAAGPVQMAQIVNQAAQSEMRIGMNTSAFGNVEVRTVVHANDVGVLIGSERGDLRALLSNELPSIAATLQQQNLRLNQVNFHQAGFAFSNQMSSGGEAQPRWFASRTFAAVTGPAEAASAESSEPPAASRSGSGTGLSILA